MRYIQRALDINYDQASYPLLALPKYNGVFIHNYKDTPYTREHNIVNNKIVREKFKNYFQFLATHGVMLEHEIIIPGAGFNYTSGVVRSADNPAGSSTILVILDKFVEHTGFKYRYAQIARLYKEIVQQFPDVWLADFELVQSAQEARAYTAKMIALDDPTIEGAVFRGAFSYYKAGRSTMSDACFLRDKAEATIDGVIIALHESTSLEGVPKGMIHSATVLLEDGTTTDVSMTNNLTDAERRHMYENQESYKHKGIQFISNPCAGMDNRHTRFDCWRPDKDALLQR